MFPYKGPWSVRKDPELFHSPGPCSPASPSRLYNQRALGSPFLRAPELYCSGPLEPDRIFHVHYFRNVCDQAVHRCRRVAISLGIILLPYGSFEDCHGTVIWKDCDFLAHLGMIATLPASTGQALPSHPLYKRNEPAASCDGRGRFIGQVKSVRRSPNELFRSVDPGEKSFPLPCLDNVIRDCLNRALRLLMSDRS